MEKQSKGLAYLANVVVDHAVVFDHAQFQSTTMHDSALQDEILGLFNDQLKTFGDKLMLGQISAEDCKFMGHTLRGSAAAVGALEIEGLAAACEKALKVQNDFVTVFNLATGRFRLATHRYRRFSKAAR